MEMRTFAMTSARCAMSIAATRIAIGLPKACRSAPVAVAGGIGVRDAVPQEAAA